MSGGPGSEVTVIACNSSASAGFPPDSVFTTVLNPVHLSHTLFPLPFPGVKVTGSGSETISGIMRSPYFSLSLLLAGALMFSGCSESVETPAAEAPEQQANATPLPPVGPDGKRQLTAEEQKVVVEKLMQARAKQQAEGLGTGTVEVNGAWNYTGYSYLSPDPAAAIEARLVAVDVTISGHNANFDIDDVEIIDGVKLISYGSDPHPEYLTLDGELMPAGQLPSAPPRASRWLLIYAFPKHSATFHLYYWGKQLTPEPVEIAERGMQLPFPEQVE